MLSVSAVVLGISVEFICAPTIGLVFIEAIMTSRDRAVTLALPQPFKYWFEFSIATIIGVCPTAVVPAVEPVGDVSGITRGGAGREAAEQKTQGATCTDGVGSAVAVSLSGFPNTSLSKSVGLITMTDALSPHVATIGALFRILCGLVPKVGAVIRTISIEVLGGSVIAMFGMVVAMDISRLSDLNWNRRNMAIFATSLSIGLGLQLDPKAVSYLPDRIPVLMTSGRLPAAFISIVTNLVLPEELAAEATEKVSAGMSSHGEGSLPGV